jgi:hypothetical protein
MRARGLTVELSHLCGARGLYGCGARVSHARHLEAEMQIERLARALVLSGLAVVMTTATTTPALAQGHEDHGAGTLSVPHKPTRQESAVAEAVREATKRFKNVSSVEGPGEGYALAFGCVSGGDFGAMGLHYVNMSLVDGTLKIEEPEIILFEPLPNGHIRITGADYLIPVAAWEASHPGEGPPQLNGQLFHLFDSPNRFGLDPFYTLHVWAWKDNPVGTFSNWNPNVSCDAFTDPK